MNTCNENNGNGHEPRLYRPHLITVEDLDEFKSALLLEIKRLLKEFSGQAGRKWLKSFEVKKLLGISPSTLQNLRINGTLPFTKIGGVMLYDYDDIQKMLIDYRHDCSVPRIK